ncbi:unnamed protein product, partial [Brassica oleracea]
SRSNRSDRPVRFSKPCYTITRHIIFRALNNPKERHLNRFLLPQFEIVALPYGQLQFLALPFSRTSFLSLSCGQVQFL